MRSRLTLSGVAIALALVAGCAGSIAPSHWLPEAIEVPQDGFGSWASVTLSIGPDAYSEGELIAASSDTLFILGIEELQAFSVHEVAKVHIQSYDAKHTSLAVWTMLGSLSTLSHGFILIISAPVWIISGSIGTAAQSQAPHKTVIAGNWKELQVYCRYPGGIPPILDRVDIKSKPLNLPSLKNPAHVGASDTGT